MVFLPAATALHFEMNFWGNPRSQLCPVASNEADYPSICPLFHLLCTHRCHSGLPEPICIYLLGGGRGYTLDRLQVNHRTHTHTIHPPAGVSMKHIPDYEHHEEQTTCRAR